MKKEAGLLR